MCMGGLSKIDWLPYAGGIMGKSVKHNKEKDWYFLYGFYQNIDYGLGIAASWLILQFSQNIEELGKAFPSNSLTLQDFGMLLLFFYFFLWYVLTFSKQNSSVNI